MMMKVVHRRGGVPIARLSLLPRAAAPWQPWRQQQQQQQHKTCSLTSRHPQSGSHDKKGGSRQGKRGKHPQHCGSISSLPLSSLSSSSSSSSAQSASPSSLRCASTSSKAEDLLSQGLVEVVESSNVPDSWNNKVVLIDKPLDWTSFDVCGKLRNLVKLKAGHAGTLDPQATGLLIVCLGKATKSVDHFQGLDKVYEGTLKLGEETASYDAATPVERTAEWKHLTNSDIERAASGFQGEIKQLPPMYSAIKRRGKKLYELARKGITVEREARPIRVDEFKVWRNEGEDPQTVNFLVRCSKGTYIRSLVHDLGNVLESAAHMTSLRRMAIGEYSVAKAWELQEIVKHLQEERDREKEREREAAPPV